MNATVRAVLDFLSPPRSARAPARGSAEHIVDNRVLLLGLDQLYRSAIMPHESTELLACARSVARAIGVGPADVPIEGYYADSPELMEYFRLVRALQRVRASDAARVPRSPELERLVAVVSAPLFGRAAPTDRFLPQMHDPLTEVLAERGADPADWSVATLMERAFDRARSTDDYSLAGLAALARDAVVLTALRESTVLYAASVEATAPPPGELPPAVYIWRVDEALAKRAARFVAAFNTLFRGELPEPSSTNARHFFDAAREDAVLGRCVRLGQTPSPPRFYHWAVRRGQDGRLEAEDFWDGELWTTTRYRRHLAGLM